MKPEPIPFSIEKTLPVKRIMREELGVGPYIDLDEGKRQFKEYVAQAVAERILHDFDKLVEYRCEKVDGMFYQEARITIMGDDVKYENTEG